MTNKFSIEPIIGPASRKTFIINANKFPELESVVTDISWFSVVNLITVTVKEDNKFSVYNWFSKINERYSDAKSLPGALSGEEFDYIHLSICDTHKNIIAKLKLNELQLSHHKCNLTSYDDDGCDYLTHEINLNYTSIETLFVEKQILTNNEIVDEEWKSDIVNEIADGEWKSDIVVESQI